MDQATTITTTERLYRYLCSYVAATGYAPTVRDMAAALGLSTSTIVRHLEKLQDSGRIERTNYAARGIRIVPPG